MTENLEAVRGRVEHLRSAKNKADAEIKRAVATNDGTADLNALSRTAHSLAVELSAAEEELSNAETEAASQKAAQQRTRFSDVAKGMREARQEFAEAYKVAALALGRFYALGLEAGELATALADRFGNGGVYYPPDMKNVLAESQQDPNPLPALMDVGYRELQTSQSWRRHCAVVPLNEGAKVCPNPKQ